MILSIESEESPEQVGYGPKLPNHHQNILENEKKQKLNELKTRNL